MNIIGASITRVISSYQYAIRFPTQIERPYLKWNGLLPKQSLGGKELDERYLSVFISDAGTYIRLLFVHVTPIYDCLKLQKIL